MATVDLDKLSAELTAAGFAVEITKGAIGTRALHCSNWTVRDWTDRPSPPLHIAPEDWRAGDIIRSHVAPVAPDPGLREAIAEVMFQHTTALTGERGPCYLDEFLLVADAVLSVLAERGVR